MQKLNTFALNASIQISKESLGNQPTWGRSLQKAQKTVMGETVLVKLKLWCRLQGVGDAGNEDRQAKESTGCEWSPTERPCRTQIARPRLPEPETCLVTLCIPDLLVELQDSNWFIEKSWVAEKTLLGLLNRWELVETHKDRLIMFRITRRSQAFWEDKGGLWPFETMRLGDRLTRVGPECILRD